MSSPPSAPWCSPSDYHCIIMLWDQRELCFKVFPGNANTVPASNSFFFYIPWRRKKVDCVSIFLREADQHEPSDLMPPPGDKVLLPQLQPIERVSDLSAPYFSASALQPSNTLIDMWMELGLEERMTHPPRSWTSVPLATVSISAFIVYSLGLPSLANLSILQM